MGLFNFGKRNETFLAVVTVEGPGRLRLNGVRVQDKNAKKSATAHGRTVCWAEFSREGGLLDKGLGRAEAKLGPNLLRDLPTNPICRSVLDRLREGQDSVGKWLQLGEAAVRE